MDLPEIYRRYPTRAACLLHIAAIRWKGSPQCPYCGAHRSTGFRAEDRYHCNACNTSYSVTVGTLFHRSRADLQRWFGAVALLVHERRGLTCRQLAAEIGVNRNTASLMAKRIRRAMLTDRDLLLNLEVNDE